MPHSFDGHGFEHLLGDVERLLARAVDHERRIQWLMSALEGEGRAVVASAAGVAVPKTADEATTPSPASCVPLDLHAMVRGLCISARDQRRLSERILSHFIGDLALSGRAAVERHPILVVDDSQDNCEMLARVLEQAGYQAITAANGLEGVLAAHCLRPSVVLMDVTMPVLDGIEATRLLKASAVTRSLNVIAHTAKADFHEAPFTRLFADVLPKPASPDAIVASVQRFAAMPRSSTGSDGITRQ
jgi:CheY-like chemotaxis protein